MNKIRKNLSYIYRKRQVLCLALCLLLLYLLKQYSIDEEHETTLDGADGYIHVELAGSKRPSVVLRLNSDSELERLAYSFNLSREPRDGDKVILQKDGSAEFSRISGVKSLSLGVPIGINTGSIDDLETLPGIGIKLAQRIVDWRNSHNGFRSIEELDKVDGIGKKKLEAIRPQVSLD